MTFLHRMKTWLAPSLVAIALSAAIAPAAAQTVTYFHNDAAGTPVLATDASGAVVWKENYQPFGRRLNAPPAAAEDSIGFAGKPFDPGTGLSYMGARYFDPVLGRFMGVDPRGVEPTDLHSFNRYSYGNNNPYKFVDPDGRQAQLTLLRYEFNAVFRIATALGARTLGSSIGIGLYDLTHSDENGGAPTNSPVPAGTPSDPKRDGEGASPEEIVGSSGGPTAGQRVKPGDRQRILERDRDSNGNWTCWRCGWQSDESGDFDIGHKNVPRSKGGNLSDGNLACEGQSCNRSAGNRGQVKQGSDCASQSCQQ
jgi:RHS repeat-associated protein